jgi:outer membrane protein assembly factor BamB
MRRLIVFLLLLFIASAAAGQEPARNDGRSWATLHGDLTRSGFYPRFSQGPLKLVWRKELYKELTGPRCEVIVAEGLAFMGTYAGKMYAWDARTGQQKWVFQAGGAIGHSPMAAYGLLYFGSMDRKLYALTPADGKPAWSFEAEEGIWTSPAAWQGLILFGARDGVFYALNAASGKPVWKFRTGAPILTTASIDEEGRRVLFASEDMHLYCLEVKSGKQLWKSRKMQGLSVRDHFPVIHQGIAMVTTNPVKDFHTILGQNQEMLVKRTGFTGKDDRYIPGTPEDVRQEQDAIVEFLKANPSEQVFYAFNVANGKEPWIAPLLYTGGLHNPLTPPCVNRATGDVFVYVRSAYGVWDGGGEVRPYTGVGRLDMQTGRVELIEHRHRPKEPGRPAGSRDIPFASFNTIGDETQTLSCSPEYLFSNHQGTLGSMSFQTGLTESKWGKRDTYGGFYGPGNFGWENQGGYEKARQAGQPYGLVNEWHGPARAIASVVGRHVYYPVGSQVLCLEGAE